MTRTIEINEKEFSAFGWTEAPLSPPGPSESDAKHLRGPELLKGGVEELFPGEVFFYADQTFVFDTTFSLKGDGRKVVIIASGFGAHVAKPY